LIVDIQVEPSPALAANRMRADRRSEAPERFLIDLGFCAFDDREHYRSTPSGGIEQENPYDRAGYHTIFTCSDNILAFDGMTATEKPRTRRPKKMRTSMFVRILALAMSLVFCAAHAAAKDIELKLSHFLPPSHPLHKAMEDWGESISRASNGSIRYKIFPAQQLGKAFDQYDMARDRIADVSLVVPSYQPGRFPIIAAGELPFMISAAEGGSRALDAWYRTYAGKEMRDVEFCLAFVHHPGGFHANRKIIVPDDVRGLKVRPANATVASFVTLLGGTNVQASAPEVHDVLEKGVAEAVTFPLGTTIFYSIDRILNYHMDAPLYTTAFAFVINKAAYEAMSLAERQVIGEHCTTDWAARVAGPFEEFERTGATKLRAESKGVYELTPEQLALWKKAAEPLRQRWGETVRKVGVDPDAAMNDLLQQLRRQNAGY
jgi:TRAP-type C4-dicarboxylate transport system substrate-binding protein